tara:strand:- start:623 stop:1204 length:582 start_codon:yes stop_codon:yes gene_type:complete
MATNPGDITQLLAEHRSGDAEALRTLLAHAYPQLRERAHQLMAREMRKTDVQATGLVNDLVIKALKSDLPVDLNDRVHFMNIMSRMMKEILIDHSRKRNALKRGGGQITRRLSQSDEPSDSIEIDFDTGVLSEVLDTLAEEQPRRYEIMMLRMKQDMTYRQIAAHLDMGETTVRENFDATYIWLQMKLEQDQT